VDPKPVDPKPAEKEGKLKGVVTLDGKPVAKCDITIVSLKTEEPQVFTATTDDKGAYEFKKPLPPGKYVAMFNSEGAKIPAKFQSTMTSGVTLDVKTDANTFDAALKSK